MKQLCILILFCFFVVGVKAQGLNLSLSGLVTFNDSRLIVKEAGEDISVNVNSNSLIRLTVDSYYYWEVRNKYWRIYVHKSDVDWNDDIILQVRRRGKGNSYYSNGTPDVNDGNSFFEVTNNPTYFFRGKGLVANIPMKFRMKNVSLTMGANDFETDVVFTIYDD